MEIQQFKSPVDIMCACPGEVLTYTCTINGSMATIWGGTAFNCAGSGIILRHSEFNNGISGQCGSDGAILGRSVNVSGTYYTSQLSVNVSNGLNITSVNCSSDSNILIGESHINVVGKYNIVCE